MANYKYTKSTNPFEDDADIDDETFLRNSRRTTFNNSSSSSGLSFDEQLQSFQERKRTIEERTINSTANSLNILRDSEQIGIATAEELVRQREKLERTDKQLDEINATLRFSQKHINGIKSVFSSLKNYMAGKNDTTPPNANKSSAMNSSPSTSNLDENLSKYDRYDNHPTTRLRGQQQQQQQQQEYSAGGSKDFSAKLDANLQEMCSNISRLKNLASDMSMELDTQNDLIMNITDKTEKADLTINKQNKDMLRLLKK